MILLFSGCGASPGSGGGSTPQLPLDLTYATNPGVYTQGVAIPADNPTSSGGVVTSYAVSPTLPAGLILSTSTGVISGTPTAVALTASYTVTGSNAAGSSTATLSITVNVAPPSGLSYSTGTAVYTVGTAISPNSPTSSGGPVASFGVSPDLPAGLNLDDDTGIIAGTPTAIAPKASYTISAYNSTGNTTTTLFITVNAPAAGLQYIPNLNQWIAPLAPQGSRFEPLITLWLVNGNAWLAGRPHPGGHAAAAAVPKTRLKIFQGT